MGFRARPETVRPVMKDARRPLPDVQHIVQLYDSYCFDPLITSLQVLGRAAWGDWSSEAPGDLVPSTLERFL